MAFSQVKGFGPQTAVVHESAEENLDQFSAEQLETMGLFFFSEFARRGWIQIKICKVLRDADLVEVFAECKFIPLAQSQRGRHFSGEGRHRQGVAHRVFVELELQDQVHHEGIAVEVLVESILHCIVKVDEGSLELS